MINIIGNIFDSSGYSSHCRNLANALDKVTEVRLTSMVPPGFEKQLTDRELQMLKRKSQIDDINLIITHPLYWRFNTTAKRNFAFLVWEGDKVPEQFIEECLNPEIEYILVPSKHTYQAIINTMEVPDIRIDNKIKIIPHGVNLDLFYPKEKPKICVFFCNKGFRNMEDRGGIQYALKAYTEEFTSKDNVEMIIKINPAYPIADLNKVLKEIGGDRKDLPKLQILTNAFDYKELVNIYNSGTVFLSPTRADAFNIPCLEAMACGLPVITTDFGGQIDFVNNENGWVINGELKEVENEVMYEGTRWLTPDLNQLKSVMRHVYDSRFEVDKKSIKALEEAKKWIWDSSAKKIKDLI